MYSRVMCMERITAATMSFRILFASLVVIGSLVPPLSSAAYGGTASPPTDRVHSALLWGLVPGGGHYYLGEPEAGRLRGNHPAIHRGGHLAG
jgi:hypothetical protein